MIHLRVPTGGYRLPAVCNLPGVADDDLSWSRQDVTCPDCLTHCECGNPLSADDLYGQCEWCDPCAEDETITYRRKGLTRYLIVT